MAEEKKRRSLNLGSGDSSGHSTKKSIVAEKSKKPAKSATTLMDDSDTEEDDDDDDILSDVESKGKNKNNMLFIVVGAIAIVVVVLLFLLFSGVGRRSQPAPIETGPQSTVVPTPQATPGLPDGIGTQDFSQNTTMTTSDTLTNPDAFVEDIYGLSTRVDYTVNRISNVADFVSYEKHRGTWGGGLELYWLDVTYQNKKYVIQVPFEYYKELDDVGIVPVRMEVLTIEGNTPTENLTVISYMCLDEEVLQDILDEQARG